MGTHRRGGDTLDSYLADVRDKPLLDAGEEVALALRLEDARVELCRHLARIPWDKLPPLTDDDGVLPGAAASEQELRECSCSSDTPAYERGRETGALLDDIREVVRLHRQRECRRRRRQRAMGKLGRPMLDRTDDEAERELRTQLDSVATKERVVLGLMDRIDRSVRWTQNELRSTRPQGRPAARDQVGKMLGMPVERLARLRTDVRRAHRNAQRTKQRMVEANLRLVLYHAKRMHFPGVTMSDVVQEGNLGLMRAVDKFNPRLGYRFSTYASWWIRQSISRAVPEHARSIRLPVHVLELQRRIRKARQRLEQRTERPPTADELAAEVDLSATRVTELTDAARDAISLDMPLGPETSRTVVDTIAESDAEGTDAVAEQGELAAHTRKLLASLPPREALVLRLRFGVDARAPHTLQQIGDLLGVTRERARQIEAKALLKLQPSARRQALLD